ncbi:MAG TPA: Fe(3+) ABC transporter substrate-binding protein [Flavobacteriaceae bacterium]|nr:Fe(3+) ABC transporter substrate-binding protein [Flavobacteriaceae bacterium]
MKTLINLSVLGMVVLFASCGQNTKEKTEETQEEQIVNVYSHRHYKADDKLFAKFTEQTGIKVNIIQASADELIQRMATEGQNSPADVLFTVDAGRLYRAQSLDLFQPVQSDILDKNIPAHLKEKNNHWYGMTYRARIIAVSKDRVDPESIKTYEDLTDPKWKGKILVRSSDNVYNQSLLASIIINDGEEKAEQWAKGIVANMARDPKGADKDQVKAVAAGEGDIAIVNTYYIGLLLNEQNEEDRKAGEAVQIIFPNQDGRGTHINVSGIGVAKYAPHKENAIKLMEYLSSLEAQEILTNLNYEFPANPNAPKADLLNTWGDFKTDSMDLYKMGEYNSEAVKIFDRVGWK